MQADVQCIEQKFVQVRRRELVQAFAQELELVQLGHEQEEEDDDAS